MPFCKIVQAGGGGSYTPETAGFPGSNDYGTISSTLTGAADSTTGTFSLWVNFQGLDATLQHIYWGGGNSIVIGKNASNQLIFEGESGGGSQLVTMTSTTTKTATDGWFHWLIVFDTSNSSLCKFYLDGSAETLSTNTIASGSVDFTQTTNRIGAGTSGLNDFQGDLADFWFDNSYNDVPGDYISGGSPVSLGSDGSTPTGSAPIFFLSRNGSGDSWLTDSSGNTNTFTLTGGPLTSPTPPS